MKTNFNVIFLLLTTLFVNLIANTLHPKRVFNKKIDSSFITFLEQLTNTRNLNSKLDKLVNKAVSYSSFLNRIQHALLKNQKSINRRINLYSSKYKMLFFERSNQHYNLERIRDNLLYIICEKERKRWLKVYTTTCNSFYQRTQKNNPFNNIPM